MDLDMLITSHFVFYGLKILSFETSDRLFNQIRCAACQLPCNSSMREEIAALFPLVVLQDLWRFSLCLSMDQTRAMMLFFAFDRIGQIGIRERLLTRSVQCNSAHATNRSLSRSRISPTHTFCSQHRHTLLFCAAESPIVLLFDLKSLEAAHARTVYLFINRLSKMTN